MNTINSPQVTKVLDQLFAEADASVPAIEAMQKSDAFQLMTSKTGYRQLYNMLKDVPLPVSRETGALLYMFTRLTRSQSVLEFGTSLGVSTIYIAAALRDNGGGKIITTEFEPSKVSRARANLTEAGLVDLVEFREGDALETLASDLPSSLDMVLLDGAKSLYGSIFELIEPYLQPGSLLIADDSDKSPDFVSRMRGNPQAYISVPLSGDLEMSMKIGS